MTSRGSETCPIDLTADDYDCPAKKRKLKKSRDDGFSSLARRLELMEEKMKRMDQSGDCANLSYAKREAEFLEKCKNLENRLDSLESCLERVSQVFVNSIIDSNSVDETTFEPDQHEPSPVINEEPQDSPHHSEHLDDHEEELIEELSFEKDQPNCAAAEECEASAVIPDNLLVVEDSPLGFHDKRLISSTNEVVRCEIAASNFLESDSVLSCSTSGNINETDTQNSPIQILEEQEEVREEKPDYLKWVLMPARLDSIKKELPLMRDDQGRVLMFLCCSFRKLSKTSADIAAVSGVYLENDLHNEFPFKSERNIKDLRIEAEIIAALCGIETIKELFRDSLSTGKVCVMVVSKCSTLVNLMRLHSVYPQMNICSCEDKACEHSAVRWETQEPIGRSQLNKLPQLMLSMKGMMVHWCKLENSSDEEKKVAAAYSDTVETILSQYVTNERKKL